MWDLKNPKVTSKPRNQHILLAEIHNKCYKDSYSLYQSYKMFFPGFLTIRLCNGFSAECTIGMDVLGVDIA